MKRKYKLTTKAYAVQYGCDERTIARYRKANYPLDDPNAMAERLAGQKNRPQGVNDWLINETEGKPGKGIGDINDAKLEKLILECKRIAFRLEVEKGLYTRNEDLREKITELLTETKIELRKALENDLPPKCEGLCAADIQAKNREALDAVLCRLLPRR